MSGDWQNAMLAFRFQSALTHVWWYLRYHDEDGALVGRSKIECEPAGPQMRSHP